MTKTKEVKEWKVCKITGRRLNMFSDYAQTRSPLECKTTQDVFELAKRVTKEISETYDRRSPKRERYTSIVMTWLIEHRHNRRVLQVKGLGESHLTLANIKLHIYKLEELGYVEIFQGFACKTGARPMAVKLSESFIAKADQRLEEIYEELMEE